MKYQEKKQPRKADVLNKENHPAYSLKEREELTTRTLTCMMMEPKFYGKIGETEARIISLIKSLCNRGDEEFVLKLAVFTRQVALLRSVPLWLLVHTAKEISTKKKAGTLKDDGKYSLIRKYTPHIIKRADELRECIGLALLVFESKNKIPKSLIRGVADSFANFTPYQLFKYNSQGTNVSLGDVINICHPKMISKVDTEKDVRNLFAYFRKWDFNDKEVQRTVKKYDTKKSFLELEGKEITQQVKDLVSKGDVTWESFISHFGSNKQSWTAIAPYLPYMATIRNIRNMIDHDVDSSTMKMVAAKIQNEKEILKSKQLPFRFLSSYNAVKDNSKASNSLVSSIKQALEISIKNLPVLGGKTAILIDSSGSMNAYISDKSQINCFQIATLLGLISNKICDESVIILFDTTAKMVRIDKNDTIITSLEKIMRLCNGGATYADKAFQLLSRENIKVDRILMFSDFQCYSEGESNWRNPRVEQAFKEYKLHTNTNPTLYSWDMRGYGTVQFNPNNPKVVLMAGYSSEILKFIKSFENLQNIVKVIQDYDILKPFKAQEEVKEDLED